MWFPYTLSLLSRRLACPPRRSHISCDDVLAVSIALNERVQTKFRIRHQRVASNDLDESLWLFVDIELFGTAQTGSIEHPKGVLGFRKS